MKKQNQQEKKIPTNVEAQVELENRRKEANQAIDEILRNKGLGIKLELLYTVDGIRPIAKLIDIKKHEQEAKE